MVEDNRAGENASGLAASIAGERRSDRADIYLDEQTRLTRLQIEQIEEENVTRRRILKLEQASAAMKVAFELAVALIVTVIAIGLGAAIWSAANDNGLVVESFSVPPDLANRGLTGDIIAARLLDKLSSLQGQTGSNRAPSSYANNWGGDIKLQIPDTGVSIGEFNRTLHAWLGHQTRITGEVYRTSSGLAVAARAGSETSPTFTGGDTDLDKLIRQAAESVYHATQPYRYAVYLKKAGRAGEAEAVYQALIANGTQTDRAWALIGLENIYYDRGDYKSALSLLDRALAIRPGFIMAYANRFSVEDQLQHDELAYIAMRKVMDIASGSRDPDMSQAVWHLGVLQGKAALAAALGDYKTRLDYDHEIEALPDIKGQLESARQTDLTDYASLHDGNAVREAYERLPPAGNALIALEREGTYAAGQMLLGRPQAMIAMHEKFDAFLREAGAAGAAPRKRQFWPAVAMGFALSGDFKAAHEWIDKTPADCMKCLDIRGRIDALEKNWRGADYWFARTVQEAPSIPEPDSGWGHVLLEKGDYDGAIAKFESAHRKGPHFADPLEMWGEALVRQNRSDLALAKFEEAGKYAPNWKRLHQKWGEALSYLGRKGEAAKQFTLARSLDG